MTREDYLAQGYEESMGVLWPPGTPEAEKHRKMYLGENGEHKVSGFLGEKEHFKQFITLVFSHDKCSQPFEWNPNALLMLDDYFDHPEKPWTMYAGHGSSAKCLAPHTKVLMYDGSVKMAKDIVVGDKLMGDDSKPRNVKIRTNGRSNMVRIIPQIGEPWECNDDHILVLKRSWAGWKSKNRLGDVVEIPVKEFIKKSYTFRDQHKQFCVGVDFPYQRIDIDPRAYGIWLGDGSTGRADIACSDKEVEVQGYLLRYFSKEGYKVTRRQHKNKCPKITIAGWRDDSINRNVNPFLDLVRESCGWPPPRKDGEKRILKRYLLNSRRVRLELLAGIIDADGHAAGTNFVVNCSKDGLASDIVYLARSLGFRVSLTPRMVKCCNNGKMCKANCICIMGNVSEIPTLRKKTKEKKLRVNSDCTGIKVEQLGEGDWCGFTVDGNERFLLADFTVTHNTRCSACFLMTDFLMDGENTSCLLTSTTLSDGKRRIWADVERLWYDACAYFGGEDKMPGELVRSITTIRYVNRETGNPDEARGMALIPSGNNDEAKAGISKMIGFKAPRMRIGLDEASHITWKVVEAIETNLMTAPRDLPTGKDIKIMVTLNPNTKEDTGGKLCCPTHGWKSVDTTTLDTWDTPRGPVRRLDGEKSPNVLLALEGKCEPWQQPWSGLLSLQLLNDQRDRLGDGSPNFLRQYRAIWPEGSTVETIFTDDEIRHHGGDRKVLQRSELIAILWGMDPSFTHGGDRTPLVSCSLVRDETGKMCIEYNSTYWLDDNLDPTKNKELQIRDKFLETAKKKFILPKNFGIDITGNGRGIQTLLVEKWPGGTAMLDVIFNAKASDNPISALDPTPAVDKYENQNVEIWMVAKELLMSGQLKNIPESIIKDLCGRRYADDSGQDSKGRISIEETRKYKKRLGHSPDEAQAFLICCQVARLRYGLIASAKPAKALPPNESEKSPFDFSRLEKKKQGPFRMLANKYANMTNFPSLVD